MTLVDLIAALNDDLGREYAHWHFYINAAIRVSGLHRQELQEFFTEEAEGEMKHIQEFGTLIMGLGGVPTVSPATFTYHLDKPADLLAEALKMEQEVVQNYVKRMDEAEELELNNGQEKIDGRYVHIFLENQIQDSRKAVDHLREMLRP